MLPGGTACACAQCVLLLGKMGSATFLRWSMCPCHLHGEKNTEWWKQKNNTEWFSFHNHQLGGLRQSIFWFMWTEFMRLVMLVYSGFIRVDCGLVGMKFKESLCSGLLAKNFILVGCDRGNQWSKHVRLRQNFRTLFVTMKFIYLTATDKRVNVHINAANPC